MPDKRNRVVLKRGRQIRSLALNILCRLLLLGLPLFWRHVQLFLLLKEYKGMDSSAFFMRLSSDLFLSSSVIGR